MQTVKNPVRFGRTPHEQCQKPRGIRIISKNLGFPQRIMITMLILGNITPYQLGSLNLITGGWHQTASSRNLIWISRVRKWHQGSISASASRKFRTATLSTSSIRTISCEPSLFAARAISLGVWPFEDFCSGSAPRASRVRTSSASPR